jgi:hypothetical protein
VSDRKLSRILTFDLLRGYFLVAIILDHLAFYPNLLDWWSGRGNLFVSSAEGFFFISGIVLGIVRGAKLADQPFQVAAKLLLKRALQLYITAVILMLFFTFVGWLFLENPGLKPGIRLPTEDIGRIIWGGLTFEYIYGWADYLRLYAIYIFATPIAIWLLRRGLWYVVLALSVAVWSMFSLITTESLELSQVYSWQLLFFGGITVGYHWHNIRGWWDTLSLRVRKTITASNAVIGFITMVLIFIFAYATDLFHWSGWFKTTFDSLHPFFQKEELPPFRILLFLVWFGAAFWLFWKFEALITRWLGWLLLSFGTNSLYVYTLQAFLVFFVHLLIPVATTSIALNLLLSIAGIMLIWFAVQKKFLMNIIPR